MEDKKRTKHKLYGGEGVALSKLIYYSREIMSEARKLAPPPALLEQIRVTAEREGNLVEAFVPIELINQEDVAFDQDHVTELADSIRQESAKQQTTGQLSPILLAEVPDEDRFLIIDGFHRTPALASLGYDEVYATIKPDCTMEDVVDLRIVAAKSHKSVKFSRIVEWVDEAWSRTEWADRINVSSAFQMFFLRSTTGSRAGINPEELEGIREWVGRKCEQWGISAPSIDRYLRTARLADPELVKVARDRTSGHKLEAVTPKHLDQIARYLPNDYGRQRIVADAAVGNTLTVAETKVLAIAVSRAKDDEQAATFVENKVWRRMDTASRSLTKKRYSEINPDKPEQFVGTLLDKFFDDQIVVSRLLIENAILAGVYSPHLEDQNGRMNSMAVESGVAEEEEVAEELAVGQEVSWDPGNVIAVAEKTIALEGTFLSLVRQRWGIKPQDGEDVLSVARMRLIQKIEAGKFPEELATNDTYLRKLFSKFVTYAAIDRFREEGGRHGQKIRPLSLDAPLLADEDLTLLDTLSDETAEESLVIDNDNVDFIKRLLPHLNERERRVLIMKGYFELTAFDIGLILGTTEATIAQTFKSLKDKTIKITQR